MRKGIRAIAVMLTLIMMLSVVSGCANKNDGEINLTIGVPWTEESENWTALQDMLTEFGEYNSAKVTLVSVPSHENEKEYKSFLKKVHQNKVQMFYDEQNPLLDEFFEDDRIADWNILLKKDDRFDDTLLPYAQGVTKEKNMKNYLLPLVGTYQGLVCNKTLFEKAGVAIPTDWASFLDAIAKLKAAGITPMAAGFADGAGYIMDELILSEGNIAEHSTLPRMGVISSWSRALKDLQQIYALGAFQQDAANATHSDAVGLFTSGGAAMMVTDSVSLAGAASADDLVVRPFPTTPTGSKEATTIITNVTAGFYVSKAAANASVDETTAMAYVLNELYNSYFNNSYYYDLIKEEGKFPLCTDSLAGSYNNTSLETSATAMLQGATKADVSLSRRMLTYDSFFSGIGEVLTGKKAADEYLGEVSLAEANAQKEFKELQKKKKK